MLSEPPPSLCVTGKIARQIQLVVQNAAQKTFQNHDLTDINRIQEYTFNVGITLEAAIVEGIGAGWGIGERERERKEGGGGVGPQG